MVTKNNIKAEINITILASITIITYFLTQIIHEGVGHGGATILFGGKIIQVTNTYLQYDAATEFSPAAVRMIAASGTLANVTAGVLALFVLRSSSVKKANMRFFLWLFGYVNLFKGFGYLMISFAPIGDWHDVVTGLPSETFWMVVFTLIGMVASLGTFFHAARTLDEFLGRDTDRRRRAFTLTLIPYLLGGSINVLAILIGLGVTFYVFTGALATFGGMFLMVWIGFAIGLPRASTPSIPLTPDRSIGWLIAGGVALAAYIFWLGPGLIL